MIFHSARIKLTLWYLLMIMFVSAFFSILIYQGFTTELERELRSQTYEIQYQNSRGNVIKSAPIFDKEMIGAISNTILDKVRKQFMIQLFIINSGIIFFAGVAGYFLAGKTLQPIESMVEDQKRFVSDASHELRTPLTALKTEIEVALRDNKLTHNEASALLQSNLEEVNKMQQLTGYLLSMGRYENNTQKLPKELVSLQEAANQALERVQALANTKRVKLIAPKTKIEMHAHPVSIVELLSILLDNAIKYSNPGGKVTLAIQEKKKSVIIEVIDQGIGIKAGDIPYIFNRFYRADTSRSKTHTEGYGLGLSIAHSIVELHKGIITVDSTPGKGSRFVITLPR